MIIHSWKSSIQDLLLWKCTQSWGKIIRIHLKLTVKVFHWDKYHSYRTFTRLSLEKDSKVSSNKALKCQNSSRATVHSRRDRRNAKKSQQMRKRRCKRSQWKKSWLQRSRRRESKKRRSKMRQKQSQGEWWQMHLTWTRFWILTTADATSLRWRIQNWHRRSFWTCILRTLMFWCEWSFWMIWIN